MMKPEHNIVLFSCYDDAEVTHDPFVSEHWLTYIVSGATVSYQDGVATTHPAGTLALIRKNQLVKTMKKTEGAQPFASISICLDQQTLQRYSAQYHIAADGMYVGEPNLLLDHDAFMKSFFDSLMPYFAQPQKLTADLAHIKTTEAIALLLRHPALKNFLFDFSDPHKIDLEQYMNRHYAYNVPLAQFARLTGRSLSTFKRDFLKTFDSTPEKWLQKKRLELAYFLLRQNKRPSDVYMEAGFENLSHFSTAFKKEYGVSPSGVGEKG